MKQLVNNKFWIICLLLAAGSAWGQSTIHEIPTYESDTTIVRYWHESISVMYTSNSVTYNKYFLLVDENSSSVRRIAVPKDVTVNDFRILNDKVYLGGHYKDPTGLQRGLLAWFDINDFYVGGGNYHWMLTGQTSMPDCYCGGCTNLIYDITRLALYEDPYEGMQIAFIGKNYIVDETTMRVGIGWASYHMGSWYASIIYNKYAEEEYSDIIATQNYVVAAARHNVNSHLVLRVFPKNNYIYHQGASGGLPCPNLYWSFYPNKYGQEFTDLKVDENVMATALNEDDFAVAYHYTNAPGDGLALKTFSISSSIAALQQGLNLPLARQSSSLWKMRDICYSTPSQQLIVLNDSDGGTLAGPESVIYQFPAYALMPGVYYGRYLPSEVLHATDYYEATDAWVATGNHNVRGCPVLYWENLVAPMSCGSQDEIKAITATATWDSIFMETNINDPRFDEGELFFEVEDIVKEIMCEK